MSLREKARAYRACFWAATPIAAPWWKFWRRGEMNPPGEMVLRDLARICYLHKTTASKDPIAMAVAEGRRQVWLHIKTQLSLTDDQISRLTDPQEPDL